MMTPLQRIFLLLFLGLSTTLLGQVPQSFHYQGVARDNGTLVTGTVTLQLTIRQGTPNGPVLFRERHFPTTNTAGVFSVIVGQGNPVQGSISGIDWSLSPLYLQTELDPSGGLSFTDMGTTAFASVPYALYARDVANDQVNDADADPVNEIQNLAFNNTTNQLSISGGNTVTIPTGGTDADADPTNEIQTLSQNGNLVTLSLNGGTVDINDADHNVNNELQTLSQNNNLVTLSQNGGTINVNDADNNPSNELQTLSQNGNTVTLSQNGGSINVSDGDSNPSNELQNLTWNPSTNVLGITAGNNVDLTALAGGPSLWSVDPFGIYHEPGDVYVGNPNGTPALHLTPTFLDFHTGDNYYSYLDGVLFEMHGDIFSSTMTNNLVRVEGAWFDSYWNNRIDSTGFYADYWGVIPGQTVMDGFGVEVRPDIGVTTSYGRLQVDQLEIRDMGTSARLDKNDLIFQVDGLGPYAHLSGDGTGELRLYNGGNWENVFAGGTNYGGDFQMQGPSGFTNVILGFESPGNPNVGTLSLYDAGNEICWLGRVVSGGGGLWNSGPNGNLNSMMTSYSTYTNHGWLGVMDGSGNQQAGMYVDASGNGVLFADGATGGVKSFVMPHPERSDTDIWYASLEGPEAAAYTRGVATLENGEIFVPFPDHFRVVANPSTMTVLLTPHSAATYGLAVVEKTAEGFRVRELANGTGSFSFDWEVKAVRKGWENWQVERPADSHRAAPQPERNRR